MRKLTFLPVLVLLLAPVLSAQQADIPLRNWTVPPYTASSSGGIHTMTDVTAPRAFIGLAVCRLLDTRPPVNNPLDGDGIYAANEIRTYTLTGACGIPAITDAVSLNVTVTNTVSNPFGHLKIWPAAQGEPNVSTLNWNTGGVTESNAAIVALSTGQIKVKTGNAGADVIIDVNGYFSAAAASLTPFVVIASAGGSGAVVGANADNTGYGVWGTNTNGIGVYGTSTNYNGVWAQATNWDALAAFGGRDGGYLQGARHGVIGASVATTGAVFGAVGSAISPTNGTAGVIGLAVTSAGNVFGVRGLTGSTTPDSAGVKGSSGWGDPLGDAGDCSPCWTAGVRGVDNHVGQSFGVLGLSKGIGVGGVLLNTADPYFTDAEGYLGYRLGANNYGVYSYGGTGGTGIKSFIEPHAKDPSKVIRYVSLEGPEAGTYFRGRGRFERGLAIIEVPEDFRLVTDDEGLSIQVTPIGDMATVAVQSIGLDRIVVRGSRNVEFFYTVNGVRRTFKNHQAIIEGMEFMPRKADATIPTYLSEGQKQLLIQNRTYKPDGTVNMETAHRLGWDTIWERDSRPQPRPEQPSIP